jgi:hypothetical protein
MAIKYTIARPSKIYPNWDFWFENIPSGNPRCNKRASSGQALPVRQQTFVLEPGVGMW